ncbi:MAG: DUF4157 domain-containing protein [Cyanobacteria bacterium SBLK]|nr:DUF4157 domain-containing protein [Cyanobacteria bacterium SBLK]
MKSHKAKIPQNNWQPVKSTALSKKENNALGQSLPTASELQHEFVNLPSDAMMGNVQSPNRENPLQTKLQLGAVGDKYEQEADRIARQVVERIHNPTAAIEPPANLDNNNPIQRHISTSSDRSSSIEFGDRTQEKNMAIQQKIWRQATPTNTLEGGTLSSDFEQNLNSAKSGGQTLNSNLQQQMGRAMGADFSGVKVHADARADRLSRSIQARAFTTGNNVFFKQGEYQPNSKSGQELIAHELTHVVQQNQGVARSPLVQRAIFLPSKRVFEMDWKRQVENNGKIKNNDKFDKVITKLEEWNNFKNENNFDYALETGQNEQIGGGGLAILIELKLAIENYTTQWKIKTKGRQTRITKIKEILGTKVDKKIKEVKPLITSAEEKNARRKAFNPDLDWGFAPTGTEFYEYTPPKAPPAVGDILSVGAKVKPKPKKPDYTLGAKTTFESDQKVFYMSPFDSRKKPDPENEKYCIVKNLNNSKSYVIEYANIDFKPVTGFKTIPDGENEIGYKPLFPLDGISAEDVKQTNLGDCYLQAALASIATKQPNHIKNMIKDNNNGTVSVDLYDVNSDDPKNHKFTKKTIVVEKSIPKQSNGSYAYNRGALWVLMIQKAYAKGGFTGDPNAKKQKTPAPSYKAISGGFAVYAFCILLGKESDLFVAPNKIEESYQTFQTAVPWDKHTQDRHKNVKKYSSDDYSSLTLLTSIFGDDEKARKRIDTWMVFCGLNKFEDKINTLINSNEQGVTLEDIEPLLQKGTFAKEIVNWFESNHIFPEKKNAQSESSSVKFKTSVPWDNIALSQYKSVKKNTPSDYSSLVLLMEIFQNDTTKIDAWIEFVQTEKIEEKIVNALKGHIQKAKKKSESTTVTLADIEEFFKGQTFTKDIMAWIKQQKIFPGKLGTGIYSKVQLEMFDKIDAALSANKPVTMSANMKITENDEKAEGQGADGEEKFGGLAGRHAYSVLEIKKTKSANPEDGESGEFRWVKIRNPWGEYSRKYTNDAEEGLKGGKDEADTGKGTSWLELSDATKYFTLLGIGDK